jgi:hypothetical protein
MVVEERRDLVGVDDPASIGRELKHPIYNANGKGTTVHK